MLLRVSRLAKTYPTADGPIEVLRDVTFDLAAGATLALEGESGSGKSTVLHLVGGLDSPTSGSVQLNGQELGTMADAQRAEIRRTRVGVIFQQFNLVPSLSVQANIAFHAQLAGRFEKPWAEHVTEALGLKDQLQKYPEALSGGQQQRVAIARTLAARPSLILADEPTGNLDEDNADRVLNLMLSSAQEAGAAVLMVTHSMRLAARMADRLILSHGRLHPRPERASAGEVS